MKMRVKMKNRSRRYDIIELHQDMDTNILNIKCVQYCIHWLVWAYRYYAKVYTSIRNVFNSTVLSVLLKCLATCRCICVEDIIK